jgi:hypothetical protein
MVFSSPSQRPFELLLSHWHPSSVISCFKILV